MLLTKKPQVKRKKRKNRFFGTISLINTRKITCTRNTTTNKIVLEIVISRLHFETEKIKKQI